MYDNRASDNVYLNRRALNYSNRPIPNRLLLPKRSYKFMIYSELKGNWRRRSFCLQTGQKTRPDYAVQSGYRLISLWAVPRLFSVMDVQLWSYIPVKWRGELTVIRRCFCIGDYLSDGVQYDDIFRSKNQKISRILITKNTKSARCCWRMAQRKPMIVTWPIGRWEFIRKSETKTVVDIVVAVYRIMGENRKHMGLIAPPFIITSLGLLA